MRSKESKHLPYKICMDHEKHIQLNNAIKFFNDENIITLDLYNNEIYKQRVRENYADYTNYVKNRISDKLFINGLYYTLFAENVDKYYIDNAVNIYISNPSNNIIIKKQNLETIYKSALWFFKDSLLLRKKDPQAKFYIAHLNTYLISKFDYDDDL